ncbi:nucleotidyltransferase domain-containing protein [Janthinobacterium psychrotolerans]|uniref:Nucleotidyltransferase domain-containing protein n=1 Tax=Janthinobacterium psychrotolerans TaxID=1747903 RepID=A0A1A7C388_9BURK|nr:nucleotidyltransferase domain-containing protein [Janthinobacterium psychrotolerans]OBV38778.1 Nucleotidyltransferase domain-containing protein [Janthinobacterium psychrotolerans]
MTATPRTIPPAPRGPFQPAYLGLIDDLRAALLAQAGELLDGIYLYGSVARGAATQGVSDLDVTLILRHRPSPRDTSMLEALRLALAARHPEVSKIDFDIGTRIDALAPRNLHSWGYWLKHHCRCIWGNDLALCFAPFPPSRTIALAVNGDAVEVLERQAREIEQLLEPAPDAAKIVRRQREAARKLLRATSVLRAENEPSWPQTLEQHAALFLGSYPAMREQIDFFMDHAGAGGEPDAQFPARLRVFAGWLQLQLQAQS